MSVAKRSRNQGTSGWQTLLRSDTLSAAERRLVELLAEGHSQAAVGAQLGLSRSAVWHRAKAIRARYTESQSG